MSQMNSQKVIDELNQRVSTREFMLGKGLNQPFNNTNSGSRKIMLGTHLEHRLPLLHPELPLIQTGYENEFGRYSSSYVTADANYTVLAKIPKFAHNPNHDYYTIFQNDKTGELDVVERISYKHITETYGFLYNNETLDRLKPGSSVKEGTVIQKSTSYDEYDNRIDGVNLLTAYMTCDETMEDSVIISESAANKLVSPLIKKVTVIINDNDILLNLYGDNNEYKTFPDIGEKVKDRILCAVRREKKEESLFTQSYERLKDIMMSDEKFTVEGRVVDINVYCNNVEALNTSMYNSQLRKYYDNNIRMCQDIVNTIKPYIEQGYSCTYNLQKLYYDSKGVLEQKQYIKDRPFSNIIMEIVLIEENKISVGDKLSDRYGGKGVVSKILPDELMPRVKDNGEIVEIIFNSATCPGRLNPGQMFETSLTFIGSRLRDWILLNCLDPEECVDLYREFIVSLNPEMDEFLENALDTTSPQEAAMLMDSVIQDNGIVVSLKPISDSITIDILNSIYKEFPWIKQFTMLMPIKDSNGNIRYVQSRRPLVIGRKYIYRLKQYAEEKFSVTSLSSTNICNQNSRSKANKLYKGLFTSTPIRFGEMESGDLMHLGAEYVVTNMMLMSSSPHGRRLTEGLLVGDPFNIDIKLDENSKNRNAEILNTYLKTMGLRLVFEKVPKKPRQAITKVAITRMIPKLDSAITKLSSGKPISAEEYDALLSLDGSKFRQAISKIAITRMIPN